MAANTACCHCCGRAAWLQPVVIVKIQVRSMTSKESAVFSCKMSLSPSQAVPALASASATVPWHLLPQALWRYGSLLLVAVVSSALFLSPVSTAATLSCKVQGHWRDVAYQEAPMKQYAKLKNCIAWTAYQFELPEELLYSILYVERGPVNGKCGRNRNGTQDCGPAQINDVRLSELKQFGLNKSDIRQKPCHNIWAMGYLVRREIEKADGNIWMGVGNYHYHYSVNQKVHATYINRIRNAWQNLVTSTYNYCVEDAGSK